jgi:hypothetical protein
MKGRVRGRVRARITCAYCEARFGSKDDWLEHIPCPQAVAAVGEEERSAILVTD